MGFTTCLKRTIPLSLLAGCSPKPPENGYTKLISDGWATFCALHESGALYCGEHFLPPRYLSRAEPASDAVASWNSLLIKTVNGTFEKLDADVSHRVPVDDLLGVTQNGNGYCGVYSGGHYQCSAGGEGETEASLSAVYSLSQADEHLVMLLDNQGQLLNAQGEVGPAQTFSAVSVGDYDVCGLERVKGTLFCAETDRWMEKDQWYEVKAASFIGDIVALRSINSSEGTVFPMAIGSDGFVYVEDSEQQYDDPSLRARVNDLVYLNTPNAYCAINENTEVVCDEPRVFSGAIEEQTIAR